MDIIDIPMKVSTESMHHVILFGPPGCGKTSAARSIAKQHRRCIVNMSELLEWNENQRTPAHDNALEFT